MSVTCIPLKVHRIVQTNVPKDIKEHNKCEFLITVFTWDNENIGAHSTLEEGDLNIFIYHSRRIRTCMSADCWSVVVQS